MLVKMQATSYGALQVARKDSLHRKMGRKYMQLKMISMVHTIHEDITCMARRYSMRKIAKDILIDL